MKNAKISRRSFLKAGAVASAVGMLSAAPVAVHAAEADASSAADEENGLLDVFKKPKYVFLFIGDGMGTAQIQSARFYKGTVDNNGAVTEADLSFTSFPQVGSVTTYDSTSFCPDSASTATSIATGHKTESGVINMCPWTRDVPYETIAEKLHAQKGYKVGVISTVNIDHATPAAFYAHQKTRKNYYEIGVELANSGFEYFAGGEFQKVKGDGTGPDNHEVAAQAGYNVVTTQADAAALTAGAGKTLIIAEDLADGKAMNYALDAQPGEWQLTDYVKKGIELLENRKGFFLMTESGKIDGAGDFRIFWELILPSMKPALATIGLFIALGYWNEWYYSSLFLDASMEYRPLQFHLYNVINKIASLKNSVAGSNVVIEELPSETLKMATAVVATGPIILLYPFVQKYFVAGLTVGSVKG